MSEQEKPVSADIPNIDTGGHPPIPDYITDYVVYHDAILGVVLEGMWGSYGQRWLFRIHGSHWCSVRQVSADAKQCRPSVDGWMSQACREGRHSQCAEVFDDGGASGGDAYCNCRLHYVREGEAQDAKRCLCSPNLDLRYGNVNPSCPIHGEAQAAQPTGAREWRESHQVLGEELRDGEFSSFWGDAAVDEYAAHVNAALVTRVKELESEIAGLRRNELYLKLRIKDAYDAREAATDELEKLRAEVLAGLAGMIPTPQEGYVGELVEQVAHDIMVSQVAAREAAERERDSAKLNSVQWSVDLSDVARRLMAAESREAKLRELIATEDENVGGGEPGVRGAITFKRNLLKHIEAALSGQDEAAPAKEEPPDYLGDARRWHEQAGKEGE